MPAPRPTPAECPPPLDRILAGTSPASWMPEVEVMGVSLFIADHYQLDDARYRAWLKQANQKFFKSVVFRALMALVSPRALVPRAGARWAAVHRGSQLVGRMLRERSAEFVLTFPPHLFDPALLGYFIAVWDAAFEHCNARECTIALAKVEPGRAVYSIDWS